MTESTDITRRRLRLRSMRRGIKEMDLLLSAFATGLDDLTAGDLALYDRLLGENDLDLLAWVIGQHPAPPAFADLVARIAASPVAPPR